MHNPCNMKKLLLLLVVLGTLLGQQLNAQDAVAQGMNYQAVARDASNKIIANAIITLKVALASKENPGGFYTEVHRVVTDQNGLFKIVIGEGKEANGALKDVPWAKEQVWLNLAIDSKAGNDFRQVSSAKLLSVPYAYHAMTASELVGGAEVPGANSAEEKNQSIYWTTGGNTATRPENHFLGTRDNQDLVIKTNNVVRAIETKTGQLQIKSGVDGPDTDIKAYPVTVEGSKQGIWIQVNGNRSTANNFLNFADAEQTWGTVEGQTLTELQNSSEYKNQVALFELQLVSLAAAGVGLGIQISGLFGTGFGAAAAVGAIATLAAIVAEAIALAIEYDNWIENTVNSVGVSYTSGSGDYAEWLRRAPKVRDLTYGEIVGVKGGQVSLNTESADHLMVVSMRPIVLGNAPQKAEEHLFEKVAFMGQVPVRVAGPVKIGDYILPSGNKDGFGVAVHPEDMKIGDYAHIVGVAWQDAKDQTLNIVNVAVGINSNDLSKKVDELNTKVDRIMNYLEGKGSLDGNGTLAAATVKPTTTFQKTMTDEEFDALVDQNEGIYNYIFGSVKEELKKRGHKTSPQLEAFFDNPTETMKTLRRNPAFLTQWAMVDQKINAKR
jgi:hypothetical protein